MDNAPLSPEVAQRLEQLRALRAEKRAALISRLDDEGEGDLALRLEKCGEPVSLTCTNCGHPSVAFKRCDLKWCPSCAPLLARRRVEKYAPIVSQFAAPLFVTFTTKNFLTEETGIRAVRRAFTKLRRLRWWKRAVAGGVASFELTNRGKGWHPHVHALIDCPWLAVNVPKPAPGTNRERFKASARRALSEVAEQWTLALGGRKGSVKVRNIAVRDNGDITQALTEVLKYSLKPDAIENVSGPVGPMLHELSLTRQLVSWGTAYRNPALKTKRESLPCACCSEFGTKMPDEVIARICHTR